MIAFEIHINGQKVVTAGGSDLLSLNAAVSAYGKLGEDTKNAAEPFGNIMVLGVSMVAENQSKSSHWCEGLSFSVGDEIRIRFIDVSKADQPERIENTAFENEN